MSNSPGERVNAAYAPKRLPGMSFPRRRRYRQETVHRIKRLSLMGAAKKNAAGLRAKSFTARKAAALSESRLKSL